MLSRQDQRQLDAIARQLAEEDPDFVRRMGGTSRVRAYRALLAVSVVLWSLPVALTVFAGWAAGVIASAVLTVAGVVLLLSRRW